MDENKDEKVKSPVLPLEGIKVLDLTQAMMGALTAMMLGDMGADVIKVERIQGEAIRKGRPAAMDDLYKEELNKEESLDSAMWLGSNRSKRSLAIDIKTEQGKEIIFKLAKETDVFMQNFRPGVIERLELGYDTISEINPQVIYCSIYGFGKTGPLARRVGGDMWSQAMGGAISQIGTPDGPPSMVPFIFVDHGGAVMTAYGIMLALFARERTGMGQDLDVSQLDVMMALQTTEMSTYLVEGIQRTKVGRGNPIFSPFCAKDGDVMVMLGVGPTWPVFCRVLDVVHLEKDPRFETETARFENAEELYTILDEAFSKKTRLEWQQIFRENRLRCDPCLTYEELFAHPQVEANEMVVDLKHPKRGTMKMLGIPVKLRKTPGKADTPPPLLGQHTEEILLKLGYSNKDVEELSNKKVIVKAVK
ncbi:MAG: CoA transferase [Thermodesulfobacteriota bacterium]|nr:CoA transferase [Thermodesulfobacteriota bacterium]